MRLVFFDLEGPLSPQDNAYEVMGLFKDGHKIFEIISKYDDILTLKGRPNYEPGDTLKLIVPFLLYHGITDEDIVEVSKKAKVVNGSKEAIKKLFELGYEVFIISTSYQQHAYHIAECVGIPKKNVACTKFDLESIYNSISHSDLRIVEEAENKILENYPDVDVDYLDSFFFKKINDTTLGRIFDEVVVIGGSRKVGAMVNFASSRGVKLENTVAIGDSITDFKMLSRVRKEGGLAMAFNGNEYCIPYANVGIATTDQRFTLPVLQAFLGGKEKAIELVKELEKSREKVYSFESLGKLRNVDVEYHCIENADDTKIKEIIEIHKKFRMKVRGEAGKLG